MGTYLREKKIQIMIIYHTYEKKMLFYARCQVTIIDSFCWISRMFLFWRQYWILFHMQFTNIFLLCTKRKRNMRIFSHAITSCGWFIDKYLCNDYCWKCVPQRKLKVFFFLFCRKQILLSSGLNCSIISIFMVLLLAIFVTFVFYCKPLRRIVQTF